MKTVGHRNCYRNQTVARTFNPKQNGTIPYLQEGKKHLVLTKELEDSGYRAKIMPIEIGVRGFEGSSAYDLLSKLSISGNKRTKALKLLAGTAERVPVGFGT
ncbi:reverse transcriptase [Elysia marginata]|uniref:Reverse transcriptase n=1 Tax=Elysia marginata TaxID=1093978 RepID=A0AAV4J7J3_9GAST|nr:reverse transcriptase [Elysia marginata]